MGRESLSGREMAIWYVPYFPTKPVARLKWCSQTQHILKDLLIKATAPGQSNNFHRRYPDLARIMDNPTSLLEYVSLGPHGQWFSRNSSQNIDWCIDDSLAHSLRAVRRQRGVEQLAFGRGGAYFCVKNGGGYKWNLKGCYPELDRLLRAGLAQCNSWIKVSICAAYFHLPVLFCLGTYVDDDEEIQLIGSLTAYALIL